MISGRDLAHQDDERGGLRVHTIWLTPDESNADVPERFTRYTSAAFAAYPNATHVLWRDKDAFELVERWQKEHFFYGTLRTPVERSDVLRMMILHDYGGIYRDVDMELKQPLPLLVDVPINLIKSPLFSEEHQSCLLVANAARHQLWKAVLSKIEQNFENLEVGKEAAVVRAFLSNPLTARVTRMVLTVFLTGPPNIDKALAAGIDSYGGQVGILPDSCYKGPVAVHHEAGSWTLFPALARWRDAAFSFASLAGGFMVGFPNCVVFALLVFKFFGLV